MKYFLYARKSTDEDDRQLLSIESQLAELRELAQKESLEIIQEFVESKTAKVPGRPVFNQMVQEIEKGKVDGIIAWHPDRLARNSVDGGKIIYLLDTGKLNFFKFPTFWFENTPQGKFMLNIAFGQSKYYVDNLSENIRRGIRQKLRRGEYPGKPPIGYLNEPRLRTIVIDEEKAPWVRRMFQEFSSGKYTQKQIRNLAANWGLVGPKGKPLALSKISEYLSHPFYIGLFRYSGELYEGSHEPMISKKLFDQVQKVLDQRAKPQSPQNDSKPFLNLIACGECGCAITAERQKGHHYYRCTKKKGSCSLGKYVREEVISDWLRRSIQKVSLPGEWVEKIMERVGEWKEQEAKASKNQLEKYQVRVSRVQAKLDRLLDIYLEGSVSREEYLSRKESFLVEKKDLREKISDIQAKGNIWLEPLETFIKQVQEAHRIAFSENPEDLKNFHKRIGSNLVLKAKNSDSYVPKTKSRLENLSQSDPENWVQFSNLHGGYAARSDRKTRKISAGNALSLPSHSKSKFLKTGSMIRSNAIPNAQNCEPPVLKIEYPMPWKILAHRPDNAKWWTRMQPIRTASQIPFEFQVFTSEPFLFQEISEKAKKLHRLGMNFHQIGKSLGVDEKTVKRSVFFRG